MLWYGFMTLNNKLTIDTYIASHLQKSGIKNVLGSKLIMNNIRKNTTICNPGILGSGLLASNLSDKSNQQLLGFSRLLEDIYKNSQYKGLDGSLYNEILKQSRITLKIR